jgi:outer membrane protein OmpA-like peptidoglycan-associated protein
MAIDLLQMMSSTVGQSLVSQAGKFLGVSDATMKSAVDTALPALLGGVMQKASTPSGTSDLMKLLNTPGLDPSVTSNLGAYLGGGEKTNSLLSMGSGLLSSLFGDKQGSLISTIASMLGMKSTAASNLMALAAPMALGFLKNHVTQNRLDAGGLATLLAGQSDFLKSKLDSRITGALGFGSIGSFLSSLTGTAGGAAEAVGTAAGRAYDAVGGAAGRVADTAGAFGRDAASAATGAVGAARSGLARWLPWLILGAIALILLPQLRYCGEPATRKIGDTVGDAAKATTEAARKAGETVGDAAKATAAAGASARIVPTAIKTFELPNGVKIDATDGGFMATLIAYLSSKDAALGKGYSLDDVHFDTASATLKPESQKQLEQLAVVLKAFPAVAVSVEGHTDSTGDAAANNALSAQRAAAVEKALKDLGVEDARITSAGHGSDKPIASNDTEDGRNQNRRVEVVVMKR